MNICNHVTLHPNSLIYEHGMFREEIAFGEITQIDLVTTSDGPFFEDVFAVLRGQDKEITIPQNAENFELLFEVFKAFEGFSYEAFIEAMSSVENATFVCWKK